MAAQRAQPVRVTQSGKLSPLHWPRWLRDGLSADERAARRCLSEVCSASAVADVMD